MGGVDGLDGAQIVTFSPDGNFTYITGYDDHAISWYERNASSGALVFTGLSQKTNGLDGLDGANGIALSPDGNHAYAVGFDDDSVSWFDRNVQSGYLSYGGVLKDGMDGVDGLNYANSVSLSSDGNHVYATGNIDDAVSWFDRNATTGALTLVASGIVIAAV